jgi:MraZ protein
MFRGRNDIAIDEKGRIMLPVKFREYLATKNDATLWLTNIDNCLRAYPTTDWLEIEQKIQSKSLRTNDERWFKRFFLGGVHDCPLDKQGRILVPQSLRKYAGLEKDVAIIGLINHFEIWDINRYDKENPEISTEEILSLRHDLGI